MRLHVWVITSLVLLPVVRLAGDDDAAPAAPPPSEERSAPADVVAGDEPVADSDPVDAPTDVPPDAPADAPPDALTSAAPDAVPDASQIRAWVDDLGASQYRVRDAATKRLIEAGSAAVAPVADALTRHGLEVTLRGMYVLQELALSGDTATEAAARQALEDVAALRVTSAARRARQALDRLDVQRQRQAVAHLKRLGARFDDAHTEMGLRVATRIRLIEIGESWRGTDEDLAQLAWLRDIDQVSFLGPRIEKRWVRHVARMPNLSIVKIKHAPIDNETLAHLVDVKNLQFVKLLYVPIDNASIEHLKQCRRVQQLLLFGTKITRESATALRDDIPGEVDFRSGAFLGIRPTAGVGFWAISEVTQGSAADRAGLQERDIIVTYQGQEVTDFTSLTDMIAQDQAGDTVSLEVVRNTKTLKFDVKLGEWD